MNRSRLFVLTFATAAVAGVGIGVTACDREPPPAPETRLLVLDGIEIRLADVEPYVAFLDALVPEGGPKTKIQRVLEDHVVPLRLAQRAFPAERQQLRQRADELCKVAEGRADQLENQAKMIREQRRSNVTRSHVQMPVAMWAFDPLKVGACSAPIELPEGWFVCGLFDLKESPALAISDYVDLLQVGFVHHNRTQLLAWYQEQKALLADKATFVHPDYVTAMPPWIRPKKQP